MLRGEGHTLPDTGRLSLAKSEAPIDPGSEASLLEFGLQPPIESYPDSRGYQFELETVGSISDAQKFNLREACGVGGRSQRPASPCSACRRFHL